MVRRCNATPRINEARRVAYPCTQATKSQHCFGQHTPITMPAPSVLPNDRLTVRFPPEAAEESYQLLELPAEILKAVEGGQSVG